MRHLILGTAIFALAASGTNAQPDGKGQSKGNGNETAAVQVDHSTHEQGPAKGRGPQQSRGSGDDKRSEARKPQPDGPPSADRGKANGQENRADRPNSKRGERALGHDTNRGNAEGRGTRPSNGNFGPSRVFDWRFAERDRERGLIAGCPPGLAAKYNGCNPPGQVRQHTRDLFGHAFVPSLFGLTHYGSGRYFYDDGYLFRILDGGGIGGYIPLLGGALAVGNIWPEHYDSYDVPDYYVDYYSLGGSDRYRYADNVIYRVDPDDAAITSFAAILTGNQFSVGQPMPAGYDIYNVPHAYRERYYDTHDAWYRYSDGHVYQIDPETQLVAAVVDLLM